jgi:hypothetical protein
MSETGSTYRSNIDALLVAWNAIESYSELPSGELQEVYARKLKLRWCLTLDSALRLTNPIEPWTSAKLREELEEHLAANREVVDLCMFDKGLPGSDENDYWTVVDLGFQLHGYRYLLLIADDKLKVTRFTGLAAQILADGTRNIILAYSTMRRAKSHEQIETVTNHILKIPDSAKPKEIINKTRNADKEVSFRTLISRSYIIRAEGKHRTTATESELDKDISPEPADKFDTPPGCSWLVAMIDYLHCINALETQWPLKIKDRLSEKKRGLINKSKLEDPHDPWPRMRLAIGLCLDCYGLCEEPTDDKADIEHKVEAAEVRLVAIEVTWRLLLCAFEKALGEESDNWLGDFIEKIDHDDIATLIRATQQLCQQYLASTSVAVTENDSGKADGQCRSLRIDGSFLKVYFLSCVLSAQCLLSHYGLARISQDDQQPEYVPSQLERLDFAGSLATLVLFVIHIIHRQRQPDFERMFIDASSEELTSASLLLIDRFAVHQCGLEEQLSIAKQLRRAYVVDAVLHFSKQWYRDHVYHVFDVFTFGLLLIDSKLPSEQKSAAASWMPVPDWIWPKRRERRLGDWMAECIWPDHDPEEAGKLLIRNWVLASLFHDVGYALEALGAVAPMLDRLRSGPVESYQEVINKALGDASKQYMKALEEWLEPPSVLGIASEDWVKLQRKSVINHGVTSFCHMIDLLSDIEGQRSYLTTSASGEISQGSVLAEYTPALKAIYVHHQNDKPIDLESDPLSFLLALVDELQDWGRPNVDSEEAAGGLAASWKYSVLPSDPGKGTAEFLMTNLEAVEPEGDGLQPPCFVIPAGGPAFHLVFKEPDAPGEHIGTMIAKAENFQRLLVQGRLWDQPGGTGSKAESDTVLVTCLLPAPETGPHQIRELEVYRQLALRERGLPYPERLESLLDLCHGRAGDMPIFGYASPQTLKIGPDLPLPDRWEVFTFELIKLGRCARRKNEPYHPFFPIGRSRRQVLNEVRSELLGYKGYKKYML